MSSKGHVKGKQGFGPPSRGEAAWHKMVFMLPQLISHSTALHTASRMQCRFISLGEKWLVFVFKRLLARRMVAGAGGVPLQQVQHAGRQQEVAMAAVAAAGQHDDGDAASAELLDDESIPL